MAALGGRGRNGLFAGLSLAVAAVIYGPMLLPGYPLRYDLVSVPGPVLGEDALGLGDRLPRAIPLDAATALLARIVPDAVLTQVLALLALTLAGWGVAVLTPAPLPGRLFALLVAQWNPFVLEQLAIGHVPHLFAYGALPWVAIFGRALVRGNHSRRGGTNPPETAKSAPDADRSSPPVGDSSRSVGDFAPVGDYRGGNLRAWAGLTAAAGFGSLTPGGGVLCVIAGVAGVAAGAMSAATACEEGDRCARRWPRRVGFGLVTLAVLQLPWLVAALAAPAFATPAADPDSGLTAFALRSETGWGRLVDAAGLAGMWNQSALPNSRNTVLAKVSTVVLLSLVAAGLPAVRRLWRAGRRPELLAGAVAAGIGYLIAVLPVLPGGRWMLQALTDVLPGAALLRDGHRWLALPAVVIAVLGGLGVSELSAAITARTPAPGLRGVAVVLLAAFLLVASMPDLAGGLGGRLRARHYPAQWAQVRGALDRSDDRARVLVLPWQPFRVFAWTGPDPVLDPAPRLLPRQSIVSDALTVSGEKLPEEGLGARAITADLADGRLSAESLRSLSVGWLLIEHATPGRLPILPPNWTTVVDGPQLTLLRAPGRLPAAAHASRGREVGVVGSQLLAGGLVVAALLLLLDTATTLTVAAAAVIAAGPRVRAALRRSR